MAFNIIFVGNAKKEIVRSFPTHSEAKHHAIHEMGAMVLEDDADHPDCSDFLTEAGYVYCIEPEGFQL